MSPLSVFRIQPGVRTVKAIIALREGHCIDEQEVIDFCKNNLASYKKPTAVSFVAAIPRNPSGKALKRLLKEEG